MCNLSVPHFEGDYYIIQLLKIEGDYDNRSNEDTNNLDSYRYLGKMLTKWARD